MGSDDDRTATGEMRLHDTLKQLSPGLVEVGLWLIEQPEPGTRQQHPGQRCPPLLARGEEPDVQVCTARQSGQLERFIDPRLLPTIERLQVQVTGLDPDRYAVSVNRIEVPLTETGEPGKYVAGVRYRAWQPPSCLHPTIPVHAPLVFDIVDKYHSRAIGGCTYHVSHPGGRSHERFPVNALEAETRRAERFYPFGHTTGPFQMRSAPRNEEMPVTLDLRRF